MLQEWTCRLLILFSFPQMSSVFLLPLMSVLRSFFLLWSSCDCTTCLFFVLSVLETRSGSISFVEFVESHVLRVKSLFDKYDINKSGSLTRFKFCELLGDMDSSLTHEEVDAIYKLVAGSEEKKVTFVNFMTLNIVK